MSQHKCKRCDALEEAVRQLRALAARKPSHIELMPVVARQAARSLDELRGAAEYSDACDESTTAMDAFRFVADLLDAFGITAEPE